MNISFWVAYNNGYVRGLRGVLYRRPRCGDDGARREHVDNRAGDAGGGPAHRRVPGLLDRLGQGAALHRHPGRHVRLPRLLQRGAPGLHGGRAQRAVSEGVRRRRGLLSAGSAGRRRHEQNLPAGGRGHRGAVRAADAAARVRAEEDGHRPLRHR